MKDKLTLTFNIFLNSNFFDSIREYYDYDNENEIFGSDVLQFIEQNIMPAKSMHDSFYVEGGDCDGWFVQGIEDEIME